MRKVLRETKGFIQSTYQVFFVLFQDILRLNLSREAAALTYTTILAMVPSIIVVFSVLTLLASYYDQITFFHNMIKDFIFSFLTLSTAKEVNGLLEKFMSFANLKSIGLSGLLWFSITFFMMLEAVELSFNEVWGVKRRRNFFVRVMRFSFFFIAAAILLSFFGGYLFKLIQVMQGLDSTGLLQSFLSGYFSQFILYFIVLTLAYNWIPNCPVNLLNSLLGALVTTVLFLFMIKLFTWSVSFAGTTRLVYSGMASLPLFIFWVFLCWVVVLLGVVVSWRSQYGIWTEAIYERDPFRNQELEKQRLKSFMPLFILIILANHKKGLLVEELQNQLLVSTDWIRTSLLKLQEKGYLLNTTEELEVNDMFLKDLKLQPKKTLDEVKVVNISKDFLRTTDDWISAWENKLAPEVFLVFHKMIAREFDLKDTLYDIMPKKKPVSEP